MRTDMPQIIALHAGQPQTRGQQGAPNPFDRPWTSSFIKEPVTGPVWLGTTNLVGDAQADLQNHGGPHKAVLAYAAAHYPDWEAELQRPIGPGGFGENFTMAGQREEEVCIGDIYSVGDAIVQVAQPRLPCWKIARRWGIKNLALRVQETGRTGWYLRVLQEGHVAAGQAVTLLERPEPQWSIARCNHVLHSRPSDFAAMQALAAVPLLPPILREVLSRWAARGAAGNVAARVYGDLDR